MLVIAESTFSQDVARWHDFYMLVGTAAATLLGLLFVAVSLNLSVLVDKSHAELRATAALTFNSFLYILSFALIFLIPGLDQVGLGLSLLALGGLGSFTLSRRLWQVLQAHDPAHPRGRTFMLWRVVLPIAWNILLLAVAVSVLFGQTAYLVWLVPVFIARLVTAVRNAWELLLHVGQDKAADEARDQEREVIERREAIATATAELRRSRSEQAAQ